MGKSTSFDVVIIGAGPAGCTAALALQGSGLSVALLEKAVFPRDKICGDAIPSPAFKAMNKINAAWGAQLFDLQQRHRVYTSQVVNHSGKALNIEWKAPTYNARRIDFDNHLWEMVKEHTSATLFENTTVTTIEERTEGMHIQTKDGNDFIAQMVIGADGANGVTARQLADYQIDRQHHCAAVRAYYLNVEAIQEGENIFYPLKNYLPGYFWIFPLGDGSANVGFGMLSEFISKRQFKLRDLLPEIIANEPILQRHFKNAKLEGKVTGFGLPLGSRIATLSGNRFLLCGDAGSLIDPLQGHGIDTAMVSARLASEMIKEAFAKSKFDADFLKQYDHRVYHKYKTEFKRNYQLMQTLQKAPQLVDVAMYALNNRVGKWLVGKFS